MEIAVVLSTFNGEKYIEEQLDSIYSQTIKPDYVLISDDSSTDNTCNIIETFIEKRSLSGWKLIKNDKNVGWKRNFYDLLNAIDSDYVFLCDQDDIWINNKIETMVQVMRENSQIGLLATNYIPKYETKNALKISNNILKTMKKDNSIEKINISPNFTSVLRPGCTYCISGNLNNIFKKYPFNDDAHDLVLWCLAILTDGLYIYHNPKIIFRRHSSNNTPTSTRTKSMILNNINISKDFIVKIRRFILNNIEYFQNINDKVAILNEMIKFNYKRFEMLTNNNPLIWIDLFSNYKKFYYSKKQLYYDLVLSMPYIEFSRKDNI